MDRCPRCSEPLEAGIGACPSCGWVDIGAAPSDPLYGTAAAPAPQPARAPVVMGSPVPAVSSPPPSLPPPLPLPLPPLSPTPSAPPPADIQVRMDGRLLTFRPVGEGTAGRDAAERGIDGAQVLRVVAYVLLLVVGNAFVYAFISVNELRAVELVSVPGPDNTTVGVLREGGYNPLSVLGLAYGVPVMVLLPPIAYGLWRRRLWAWMPAIGVSFLAMGAFPIGTGLGPALVYLLTRPIVREAVGAPQEGLGRPTPYGERPPGR